MIADCIPTCREILFSDGSSPFCPIRSCGNATVSLSCVSHDNMAVIQTNYTVSSLMITRVGMEASIECRILQPAACRRICLFVRVVGIMNMCLLCVSTSLGNTNRRC